MPNAFDELDLMRPEPEVPAWATRTRTRLDAPVAEPSPADQRWPRFAAVAACLVVVLATAKLALSLDPPAPTAQAPKQAARAKKVFAPIRP